MANPPEKNRASDDLQAPRVSRHVTDADYRLMVESIADYAIFLLDPDGMILSWNRGAQKMKGYEAGEVLGRHIALFYPQEQIDRNAPEHGLNVARETGIFEDEGWRLRKDGTRFWANIILTRITGPNGELTGFSKITRDLSERRRQQELLRLSEERFRLLVERVQDYAIFMLDPGGHVVSWNAGAQKNKGYAAAEIIGQHFSVFYPADVAPGWPDEELRIARQDGRFEDEGWRIRKDGSRFWANVVITSLNDDAGRHRGFAKVTRDLTERRRVTALEDEGRRITNFLAMLGHELRNPLAPISNAVALLEQENSESQALRATREIIGRQLRQLNRLVDDLLDVGRITSGKIQLEARPVHFMEALHEAIEAVRPLIDGKSHVLDIHTTDDPWVLGDHARIVQILSNLIGNAAKFTPAAGRISVRIEAMPASTEVRVIDNGPGIPPHCLQKVFELFFQGEQDMARSQGGLGLGLSLVQQLVVLHGGEVSVFSKGIDGEGTEFVIRL
ncbi:MAG: PAS domain S-box protein, partial [Polaromonas sp.]